MKFEPETISNEGKTVQEKISYVDNDDQGYEQLYGKNDLPLTEAEERQAKEFAQIFSKITDEQLDSLSDRQLTSAEKTKKAKENAMILLNLSKQQVDDLFAKKNSRIRKIFRYARQLLKKSDKQQ